MKIEPYSGFVNPDYELVTDAEGNVTDVKIIYPTNFVEQHLEYGKEYSFLPSLN